MTDLDPDALGLAVAERVGPSLAAAVMSVAADELRGQLAVVVGRPALGGLRFRLEADAAGVWLAVDVDLTSRGGPALVAFCRVPGDLFVDLLPADHRAELDQLVAAARADAAAAVPDDLSSLTEGT